MSHLGSIPSSVLFLGKKNYGAETIAPARGSKERNLQSQPEHSCRVGLSPGPSTSPAQLRGWALQQKVSAVAGQPPGPLPRLQSPSQSSQQNHSALGCSSWVIAAQPPHSKPLFSRHFASSSCSRNRGAARPQTFPSRKSQLLQH